MAPRVDRNKPTLQSVKGAYLAFGACLLLSLGSNATMVIILLRPSFPEPVPMPTPLFTPLNCSAVALGALENLACPPEWSSGGRAGGRWVDISVLTAPAYFDRRREVRQRWLNRLRCSPLSRCIRAAFVLGHSPLHLDMWGNALNQDELQREEALLQTESRVYGDLFRLPHAELYRHLPDKTLQVVTRGVRDGFAFIFKIDDDIELNVSELMAGVSAMNASDLVYGGYTLLKNSRFPDLAVGVDGVWHDYYHGPAYMLTRGLAKLVALSTSSEYIAYGQSSEDVDMGIWVSQCAVKSNRTVEFKTWPFAIDIPREEPQH